MELLTIKGTNLNTTVYRGFASIKDIAHISAPDTENQDRNPDGLQRNLSVAHAREGYSYAEDAGRDPDHPRLWPEVILNVRDKSVIDEPVPVDEQHNLFKIVVHEDRIDKNRLRPQISRTDGNHRLFYGEGHPKYNWPALDVPTPFAITIGLEIPQETDIFIDVNHNQKAMDTSHLLHLRTRLTPSELLASEKPALWIANELVKDSKSPFHGIVYLGGEKEKVQGLERRVNLAQLRTGSEMILKESIRLRGVPEVRNKYVIIRTYWSAVATVFSEEWADSKKYLLLRGFGVWCMAILGAEIIDRCFNRGIPPSQLENEMADYLSQTSRDVNWDRKEGNITHKGGRVGARELADIMKMSLSDESVDMGNFIRDLKSLY
ncbi:MAG: DGQHR domain-containing protein [Dehalococcoidia bacterium]|nr:MAG: DGQHR domain-containing protein [Dehalococcoidia bacterium]